MEHVDDLIAAHAVHSLDADDARRVEEHLAGCAACRAKLRELEAVAGALAYAAPRAAPPPELRTRLMEAIGPTVAAQPQPPAAQRARPARRRGSGWWPRLSAVVVPALAAAVVAMLIWNVSLRNDLRATRHGVATGVPVALPGVGNAVAAPSGAVTMYASAPAAPSGKTYEAWVIRAGKAYPAGLFGGGTRQFTLTLHVRPGDTIAVTVEPAGGRLQPTSKPVAAGRVQRI